MNKKSNLTKSQFLMWMGQHLDPDLPLYNMVFTFKFFGEIEKSAFQQAFQILVNQTDAMRLVVEVIDDIPKQSVCELMNYKMDFFDFSEKNDPKSVMKSWQIHRTAQIFDMTQCLFDSVLIKLTENQFIWFFNQHHIAVDIWSTSIIYKRMAEIYQQIIDGDLKQQQFPRYQEYIDYEYNFRQSSQFKKIKTYWNEKLRDSLEPTQFFDKAIDNKSARTQRFSYSLNQQQVDAFNSLVERSDVRAINKDLTNFSVFSAVLFMLMFFLDSKSSKEKKLRIGTPFHNRSTEDFKETVGLFIEVGVLQIEIKPQETFLSLLKKIQAEVLTGLKYAQPGSSSAKMNSAYDVLLNYIHVDYGDFSDIPMQSEWIHSGYGDRHHNCRLQVHDHDKTGGFILHFDLNMDVFTHQQSQWFIEHFVQGLNAIVTDPLQALEHSILLSKQQWQNRIIEFNATHVEYSPHQTIISLFEEQVRKTPRAIALVLNKKTLTYHELNQRINILSEKLQGVQIAGILLERSMEAIISILGILKAGGAYVPIDPTTPAERIFYILKDSQVSILLTQQKFSALVSQVYCEIVFMDTDWKVINSFYQQASTTNAASDALAYIIYTSGSTGKPKGVMIPHQGLLHYIQWAKKFYLQGQSLDFPLYSSLAFDLTITSIFTPLVSGGKLIIYPEEPVSSSIAQGMEILSVIEDNAVDIIKMTPSHLNLLKELSLESTRIKKIIVGGEDFKTNLAWSIHEHFILQNHGQQVTLFNEYGPTETTVACMIHQYHPNQDKLNSVPIGHPIDNTQIYILDNNMNPVPTGVIGELYIAGNGVGCGYINQPEATKKSYLNSPFTENTKIYRSGDQARWIDKDQLELLGRVDKQVKIKGYRIELEEIEAVLLKFPEIQKAVVNVVQHRHTKWPDHIDYCNKCGLPSNYPETKFDEQGICNTCRDFEAYQTQVESYFRTRDDLQLILEHAKASKTGKYDCLVLLSGGKDSTYMLCQLVEAGVIPLVFSLDNGYISESAKENVKRITEGLSLDHIWACTADMNTFFRDSLQRFSNVCHGCFKAIYTLAYNLAQEKGIKYIVTGLSRGQLFETRLSDTLDARIFDATEIDQIVLDARKIYHRLDDAISQCMDTQIFENDTVFEDIQFVDFYRYTDVEFEEMYEYLINKTPWERPKDTGRSTNCLINELGIYVHKKEQGYHNYALPYSWDVRIGHKVRAEALHELNDDIDMEKVSTMLKEIGYNDPASSLTEKKLVAYYVSKKTLDISELKTSIKKLLPEYMIPEQFYALDEISLTISGKVDYQTLNELVEASNNQILCKTNYVEPRTEDAILLADIWETVLHRDKIGLNDNFFDLGGDSISSIQIIIGARRKGIQLQPKHIFEHQTIAELVHVAKKIINTELQQNNSVTTDFPLSGLDSNALNELADVLDQLGEKT